MNNLNPKRSSPLSRIIFVATLVVLLASMLAVRADEPPGSEQDAAQDKLERAFTELQKADQQIPADSYDPVAVVKAVEGRPDDLFAWVRDNTRWAPYRGALRGPLGVLVDRLGNSLDRSLLLAEFYRHTPVKCRLAHAKLTGDQARSLYQKLRAAPRPQGMKFEPADAKTPAAQKLQKLGESLAQSAASDSKTLLATLAPAKAPLTGETDAINALADHWWLQRADGTQWVDLDPTLPAAKPGDHIVAPAETFTLEDLPAELWHTLRIAVIAEQWADGKLTQSPVLARTVRPGTVLGGTIYLTNTPLDWPHTPPTGTSVEAAKGAKTQALTPTEWVPILRLGTETATDAGVRNDGSADPRPQMDATARAGSGAAGAAKSAAGAFDAAFGAPPPKPAPPAGLFTAEWVEYTLHRPGAPDEVIRREVFDLIGPAARAAGAGSKPSPSDLDRANAALALCGRIDIVALPCQPSPNFVGHLLLSSLIDAKPQIEKAVAAVHSGNGEAEMSASPFPPSPLYGFALLRRAVGHPPVDWYIARANVFAFHNFARLTADDQQTFCQATDLIANDVAVEPGSDADPVHLRLNQGVFDTVAEGAFLPEGDQRTSAADTLAAASSQSLPWIVVRAAADLDKLKLPADDAARIRAEISAGRTVIVPPTAVRIANREQVAWWSVDPATGRTLGMGDHGWGPDLGEDAFLKITQFIMTHKRWVCLGAVVSTVANTLSPLFNLSELSGDALSAIQAALDAACGAG